MEQKQEEIAIAVDHISKVYKLYDKPMDRMENSHFLPIISY